MKKKAILPIRAILDHQNPALFMTKKLVAPLKRYRPFIDTFLIPCPYQKHPRHRDFLPLLGRH
jgi:hypothetical protein